MACDSIRQAVRCLVRREGQLDIYVRDPRLFLKAAEYGIQVPFAGSFLASLRPKGLDDLVHVSEFVGDDNAGRANMSLGSSVFDLKLGLSVQGL